MTALPSFDEVFAAAYPGRSAFPWQRRLADAVLAHGWPELLDLPTGVGKTTALDVALYCLAADPARMPRRTVLVVDRRIVVDQGADHARELQRRMADATGGPLATIAARLRALWHGAADEPPFAVAVMRGGMPRDNDWAGRPDQPVLGVSTVDQIGSRLLFRGYGVSDRSASIHAGLIGNDTLILLDEVHLANAFADTLQNIRTRFRKPDCQLPDRFMVTQMSATARSAHSASCRFGLDDADRAHPVLTQRLSASKRATLQTLKVTGDDDTHKREALAERAVREALELQAAGARVVTIVVNRVDTARIANQLLARHRTTDVELVTGRMRPIERDHVVRERLLPRAGANRTRTYGDPPLVVVATQCIEAGADLDFDAMVTECASLDALRQRFGRVDRRGELRSTSSVIIARSDQIADGADDPIYGGSLAATWRWLTAHATGDTIDFGISSLPAPCDAQGRLLDDVLPPIASVPVLLPTHLDAWAQTSQRPKADPDVALWLHGEARPGADVQLVWRVGADVAAQGIERMTERLQSCRPSALEAVTIPLRAARAWLAGAAGPDHASDSVADVEGDPADGERVTRRERAAMGVTALRWRGDDSTWVGPDDLRPGDVLVLDAARGGLHASSFDPASVEPVIDLGDLAQLRGRGIATLRLDRDALSVWRLPIAMLDALPGYQVEETPVDRNERIDTWLALWPEQPEPGFIGAENEWRALRSALQSRRRRIQVIGDPADPQLIVTASAELSSETADAVTEDDDSSFRRRDVTLAAHSGDVRQLAERYARALGFDATTVADLGLAAWFHDTGKADPRFQRWLAGGDEIRAVLHADLLAKSASPSASAHDRRVARQRAGYPGGCRHELLSLAMVQRHEAALQAAHDRDLVLHLVSSHHGWCRPFPPAFADETDLDVRFHHGEHELRATTAHHLARLDSGVAPRFWRLVSRYGWWGLAWLEAIIRLADHRASEQPGGES